MKFKNIIFVKSSKKSSTFPTYAYPEFAFFGRSNVGKSSLINMVLGKKNLVKTGSRPGVTQMVNFFSADDKISFADLPGYGFAKVPRDIRKQFYPLMQEYITERNNLKLAFLLIDIRRKPGEEELKILELLTTQKIPVAVTITKCDKASGNLRSKNLKIISKELGVDRQDLFITSSSSGEGKKDILRLIDDFL